MVTTRGKQHIAAGAPERSEEGSTRDPLSDPAHETPKIAEESLQNLSSSETVGSRLRKRRRTDSTIVDDNIPSMKRKGRRKTSPAHSRISPTAAPQLADLQSPQSHQDASIDPQLAFTHGGSEGPAVGGPPMQKSLNDIGLNGVTESTGLRGRALLTEANPDLAAVISNIINHGEAIDNHYAAHGLNELGIVDTESFLPLGASMHLKIQSLPILDNLAIQLLNTLAKSTFQEILAIATDAESEAGQAYSTLKSLFDHTKKVYSVHEPFLLPYELGLSDPAHIEIIRKANLATFISSIFGSQDVGFYHLNEFFLETFVGDSNRLLKTQVQLFLDLKTQAFISAQSYGQRHREELLEDLFPADLEERLLQRRSGSTSSAPQLTPSEIDFLQRARNRRRTLLEEASSDQCMAFLTQKYVWEDFLRDISSYVSTNFEPLVGVPMHKNVGPGRISKFYQARNHDGPSDEVEQQGRDGTKAQHVIREEPQVESSESRNTAQKETVVEAVNPNDAAPQGFGFHEGISVLTQSIGPNEQQNGSHGDTQPEQNPDSVAHIPQQAGPMSSMQHNFEHQPPQPPPHVFYNQSHFPSNQNLQPTFNHTPVDMNIQQQFYGDQPAIPFPTQSAPTQVLYERARQAATAKASPNNRRAGTPSQRRPWSTEEENALMAGLDRVKGPHWSQILAMFGPGGTINEILKDRNQVQLKDKARNLKLFFLKSGIEVPYYLQCVTGELKTRAPAQVAKHEARDNDKDNEERAHIEGVMTLAGVHESARTGGGDANAATGDVDGDSAGENDLSLDGIQHRLDAFGGQQQSYQQANAPGVGVLPMYNNEVTPAFQAMIDAAAAEAARVGASAE